VLRLIPLLSRAYLRLRGAERRVLDLEVSGRGPVRLVYYRQGPLDGEPWLLLHGMGSFALGWRHVMGALSRECRLVAPELSALGGTEAPGGGLGIRSGARAATALIERELGGRRVTVAGFSLGGWMAVRLALARPELVSRLVLIDAGGYRHQDWEAIQELVDVQDLAGVDRLYRAFFVRTPKLLRPGRRTFLRAYTSPGVRQVLARTTEDDAYDDADLARLDLPVALIWGGEDGLFRPATAKAMAAALPRATLEILPGCGHVLQWDCPGGMVAAIQRFRRAAPAAPARVLASPAAE
jgi:pimeloyl-ACP methyl ester carboxylesterase